MRELGNAPGRIIGEILERLVELVTEEPEANTHARLLAAAREIAVELRR
jgi:tRNA nucleotidyltransferase (CCA-adding enzyme)